ncbi:MAG: triphosphoribosyl-dephospho-CoA synthase CitG [Verrucomicrobia bacterium]|nr:triphosphoribosyl-dephospho-CoA synthase CitG [Verrucomicrobiota bacterium]
MSKTITQVLQGPVDQAGTIAWVASCAAQALETEFMLTPKPGLVDQRNCGAHYDMDLATFLASAQAIAPWWLRFVEMGYACAKAPPVDFLGLVRPTGIGCEKAMLNATRGVNTHKGAVFALGLLCSAAGRLLGQGIGLDRECLCSEVAQVCSGLVTRELSGTQAGNTAGERCFRRYGITGARGEAVSGYAAVRTVALPVYDGLRRQGVSESMALLQTLLHLMAVNSDTNLVSRGGLAGLNFVREYSRKLLGEGGVLARDGLKKMEAFDAELVARRLSPGGSADLLAVTWFLSRLPPTGVRSE